MFVMLKRQLNGRKRRKSLQKMRAHTSGEDCGGCFHHVLSAVLFLLRSSPGQRSDRTAIYREIGHLLTRESFSLLLLCDAGRHAPNPHALHIRRSASGRSHQNSAGSCWLCTCWLNKWSSWHCVALHSTSFFGYVGYVHFKYLVQNFFKN